MQHFNFIRVAVGIIKDCNFNKFIALEIITETFVL